VPLSHENTSGRGCTLEGRTDSVPRMKKKYQPIFSHIRHCLSVILCVIYPRHQTIFTPSLGLHKPLYRETVAI
jgi:hypothetical protein